MSFAPCPTCSRHVKSTDATCPFCKNELPDHRNVLPVKNTRGLSRAAAYAISASLAVAGTAAGCSAGSGPIPDFDGGGGEGGGREGGANDGGLDETSIAPPYGAPAYGAPAYGAPPYGAPPQDGGSD